jgi:ABC-2 type transport system ATP-binding protein
VSVAELRGVTKAFGATIALDDVTLVIEAGEIVALLGPNGAGKTTALGILVGLRPPDRGGARLFGADPRKPSARTQVGVTPQAVEFPPTLRVREILDHVRAHYRDAPAAEDVLERFGLEELARRQLGGLSGGERRRLAVALAFAGAPSLVLLDEPSAGLDVEGRRSLWNEVAAFAGAGGTVLLTTHYLEEAERLASRIVVIDHGRVVRDGTLAEIRSATGLAQIRLDATLDRIPGAERISTEDGRTTIHTRDVGAVVRWLVHNDVPLDGLEVSDVSLEEALRALGEDAS